MDKAWESPPVVRFQTTLPNFTLPPSRGVGRRSRTAWRPRALKTGGQFCTPIGGQDSTPFDIQMVLAGRAVDNLSE